jgi:hypothetical protein
VYAWKKKFEMCTSKTYLFSLSFTAYICLNIIFILIQLRITHDHKNKKKKKLRKKAVSYLRYLSTFRNSCEWGDKLTAWIIIVWKWDMMTSSDVEFFYFDWETKKEKQQQKLYILFIHSGGIIMRKKKRERTNKRKLLASLFLFSSLHSGEREIENHRKRNKIKILSMTISCLSFEYKKKRQ